MSVMQLKKEILSYVNERRNVNFIELQDKFPDQKGDKSLVFGYENLVVWVGLSETMEKALVELVDEQKIWLHPATEYAYIGHGGLNLPIATKITDYKKPHWLRMTIDIERPSVIS